MPSYEYRCLDCNRRFEIFLTYDEYGTRDVNCPHCQSAQVKRRLGRVRIAKSDDQRLDDFSDPSALDGLEDDPQALGRMMRKMSGEMGEDLGPEFDEVVERLEKGQSPEDIEKELPDLGGDDGGLGGAGEFGADF